MPKRKMMDISSESDRSTSYCVSQIANSKLHFNLFLTRHFPFKPLISKTRGRGMHEMSSTGGVSYSRMYRVFQVGICLVLEKLQIWDSKRVGPLAHQREDV